MTRTLSTMALAGAAAFAVLFASDDLSVTNSDSFVTQAQARVGRPLTPVSAAGVARRNTRRAVGATAVGAAAVGAAVMAPGCIRDAHGAVVCR
jgi:hypothetical protein